MPAALVSKPGAIARLKSWFEPFVPFLKFAKWVVGAGLGSYLVYYQVVDPRISLATVTDDPGHFLTVNFELENESLVVGIHDLHVSGEFGVRGRSGSIADHITIESQLSNVKELKPRGLVFVGLRFPDGSPAETIVAATVCVVATYRTSLGLDRREEYGLFRMGGTHPSAWLRRGCGDDPLQQQPDR